MNMKGLILTFTLVMLFLVLATASAVLAVSNPFKTSSHNFRFCAVYSYDNNAVPFRIFHRPLIKDTKNRMISFFFFNKMLL
jgi:hypothetical protein